MSSAPDAPPASLTEAVAAEIERQLAPIRAELARQIADVRARTADNRCTIIVFSGDLDKVLTAFAIATGAAAAGLEVSMFFTFWGLAVLRKPGAPAGRKTLKESLLRQMTPSSSVELGTSRLHLFGLGSAMLRAMMKEQRIASLEELMAAAREMGVRMMACTMSMDAMGVTREELVDGLEYGGVSAYLADAVRSRVSLFI